MQTIGIRKSFGIVAAACGLVLSAGAAWKQPARPPRQEAANAHPPEASNAVKTQLHNVNYHFSDSVFVHVKDLNGQLEPIAPATYPVFDNKDSFALRVDSAEMSITAENLANVLNSYVFARGGSPVSGFSISVKNGELKIKGRLHQAGALPFETDGAISVTPDGKIQLHAAKVKALHIPVKGLMSVFGVDLADLIKNGKIPGVETTGDDLILDPALVFPPPHLRGKVSAVRLEGDSMVLTFGVPQRQLKPLASGNYMAYRGNRLAFGRLMMSDADITLIDMDPGDPLDFSLDRYLAQITAGYAKITPTMGLRVYIKDLNKLGKLPKEKSSGSTQKN